MKDIAGRISQRPRQQTSPNGISNGKQPKVLDVLNESFRLQCERLWLPKSLRLALVRWPE